MLDSLHRTNYAYRAEVDADQFVIEDVDIRGQARRHGPFQLERIYGTPLENKVVDWAGCVAEHNAAARQQADSGEIGASFKAPTSSGPANVLLDVRKTGLQRITYEALAATGITVPDGPDKFYLSNRGVAVPIYVSAKKFGPGAYLEFYGQALDTQYTDTNVYLLQVGGNGKPTNVQVQDAAPPLVSSAPASYTETFLLDRHVDYANYAPGDNPWYDTFMLAFSGSPNTSTVPFDLDGLADAGATASSELEAWGVTDWPLTPDHHLVVGVNGTSVLDETFDGLVAKKWQFSLPTGTLQEIANQLQLTLPADTGADWDVTNFARMTVHYQRIFRATQGRLKFTARAADFRVIALPSNDVVVYRMDAKGARRLVNFAVQPDGASWAVRFAGDSSQSATYAVTTTSAEYVPTPRIPTTHTNLNATADYLIISHPDFIAGLQPLVDARTHQGLRVNVVDVNDVYAAFGYSIFDPQAIKDYIAYAAKNLGIRSVLLVGGDTYDYRNYLGVGSVSSSPPSMASPAASSASYPRMPSTPTSTTMACRISRSAASRCAAPPSSPT